MTGTSAPSRFRPTAGGIFCLVLLVLSAVYLASALRLDFLAADGRPGPGFFPRIVGVSLVAALAWSLRKERVAIHALPAEPRAALAFGALGAALVAGIVVVGAWPAIALYLLASLSVSNPRRRVANVLVSLVVPLLLFLLFDALLGVPLPQGVLFRAR